MNELRYFAYRHKETREWASHTPYLAKSPATSGLYETIRYQLWKANPSVGIRRIPKDRVREIAKEYELVTLRLEEVL